MLSFLGGGYDAPRTPLMSRGDEESIEESKMPETTVVGAGDSGGNDPHSCGRQGIDHPDSIAVKRKFSLSD